MGKLCYIVRYLSERQRLTLISHSLVVLSETSRLKKINTISLGGIYNASVGSFVGISTFEAIRTLSVNVAVMAATGVSIKHGLANTTYFEAEIKRMAVTKCDKIIPMAVHTKFGRDALITYCPLERVSTVVTGAAPSAEYMDFFQKHDVGVFYPDPTL